MKVKIVKCYYGIHSWYYNLIGKIVSVKKVKNWDAYFQLEKESTGYFLSKRDVEII